MWSAHHRDHWPDLDAREEPTDAGRRLDAGGFVLADRFETILRSISAPYLHTAWDRLSAMLTRYQLAPTDLSWGWLHPGGTTRPVGLERGDTPSDFVGWTSRDLKDFDLDSRFEVIDAELAQGQPTLRCAVAWRSLKWTIAPDDEALGLRLIEALSTDEVTDWAPDWILQHADREAGAWIEIARALHALDQEALDQALAQARATYSPLGYRMVRLGFAAFVHQPGQHLPICFPQDPNG
jgi:hypothetical protein